MDFATWQVMEPWFTGELTFRLLLTLIVGVASGIAVVLEHLPAGNRFKSRQPLPLFAQIALGAACFGAIGAVWNDVTNTRDQYWARELQRRESDTLMRQNSNEIRHLAAVVAGLSVVRSQNEAAAEEACSQYTSNIKDLQSMSKELANVSRGMRETLARTNTLLGEIHEMKWPLDTVLVSITFLVTDSRIRTELERALTRRYFRGHDFLGEDHESHAELPLNELEDMSEQQPFVWWLLKEARTRSFRVSFKDDNENVASAFSPPQGALESVAMTSIEDSMWVHLRYSRVWATTEADSTISKGSMFSLSRMQPLVSYYIDTEGVWEYFVSENGPGGRLVYEPPSNVSPFSFESAIIHFGNGWCLPIRAESHTTLVNEVTYRCAKIHSLEGTLMRSRF